MALMQICDAQGRAMLICSFDYWLQRVACRFPQCWAFAQRVDVGGPRIGQ